ncbi:MAG: LLM class flavin-dependent oxidoreductase [Actinomycetota bacterium]|nr:LLM class flavin-dependent oxidoreductase [Actinomycetota bacterium]MDQ3318693.1 LLM class flavin-dependent oxidoreductase [Actinomycetota bacterium]MDQ3356726.1 LLM class flavin-dependent oxidoreductase [Actinomycetota bacterium]
MVTDLRLSVLDQSPISEGTAPSEALHNSVDLARHTEELRYHRYWVAEHHGTPMLACNSPEVLIGAIAAATDRIRVGSGGVMLPHYSPFRVAETFSMLSGLHPGRIDLGMGRAPGTDQLATLALQRDRRQLAADDFRDHLAELLGYLDGRLPADHPFVRLAGILPGRPHRPESWLLGSSPQSAVWAAELGLPYCFADFINPQGAAIVEDFRRRFAPSEAEPAPRAAIAVVAICAETDEEAERLAASHRMAFSLLRQGRLIPVPTVEQGLRYAGSRPRRSSSRRFVLGSPATVRAGIEQAAEEYGVDEVLLLTITYEHEARRRSYELIAEGMGLAGTRGTVAGTTAR